MDNAELFDLTVQLSKYADQLEALQIRLMRSLPDDARRGGHLYEAAHGLGAIPNNIRRSRGHIVYHLREQGEQ